MNIYIWIIIEYRYSIYSSYILFYVSKIIITMYHTLGEPWHLWELKVIHNIKKHLYSILMYPWNNHLYKQWHRLEDGGGVICPLMTPPPPQLSGKEKERERERKREREKEREKEKQKERGREDNTCKKETPAHTCPLLEGLIKFHIPYMNGAPLPITDVAPKLQTHATMYAW